MIKLEAISIVDKASRVLALIPSKTQLTFLLPSLQLSPHSPHLGCAGSKAQKALPYSPSRFTPSLLQGLSLAGYLSACLCPKG